MFQVNVDMTLFQRKKIGHRISNSQCPKTTNFQHNNWFTILVPVRGMYY